MSDLSIRVQADDKGLDAQLKGISKKFAGVASTVAAAGVSVAAIAGIAKTIDGLAALGEEAIKSTGALEDQAKQLRVSAEALQEYRLVANAAGVGAEQFDKALAILGRTIGNSALGKGTFEKDLANVGIQLRDHEGRVKSVSMVYADLSEKVRSGALSAEQSTGLMAAAFGRDGGKMVEVLRQTEAQQRAVIDAAREYGAIISNDVVAAADEYGDKLELVQKGTEALTTQSKLMLAPLTLMWAEFNNEIARATGNLLGVEAAEKATIQKQIATLQKGIEDSRKAIESGSGFGAKFSEELQHGIDASVIKLEALRQRLAELSAGSVVAAPSVGGADIESDSDRRERLNAMFPELDLDAIRAMQTEVLQQMPDFQEQVLEEVTTGGAARIELLEQFNFEEAQLATQHQSLLTKIHREGEEARRKFSELSAKAKADTILGSLVDITAGVAQNDKRMFELNKAAALAQAAVALPAAVLESFRNGGGWPWGAVAAGAMAAAGLAQINAIKNTTFGGGGKGTTPSAAGSTPTVNDQPVAGGTGRQRLLVEGLDPSALFTGGAVRSLAQKLIDFQRDGGQVILK